MMETILILIFDHNQALNTGTFDPNQALNTGTFDPNQALNTFNRNQAALNT